MNARPARTLQTAAIPNSTARRRPFVLLLSACFLTFAGFPAFAQRADAARRKLPAADKIVNDYLKAVGGRRRLLAQRDATYEWAVEGRPEARALTHTKAPGFARLSVELEGGSFAYGATPRSAWERRADGGAVTLTDAEAKSARLQARLDATRLADYKKQNLLAVTVGTEQVAGEQAHVVEFRSRDAARVRYLFGAASKLLLRTVDEARKLQITYGDYRPEGGVLEPHRVELQLAGASPVVLTLRRVSHNTNLADGAFDAPSAETLDVGKLINEVIEGEPKANVKFEEYTFSVKETERELDGRGDVSKETVRVWEVFLAPNGNGIGKLVSVNNRPLPPDKAAKEEKRVADYLAANDKTVPKSRQGAGGFSLRMGSYGFDLRDLLRSSEFVAPRRERFQGRESVVFDFRPRADFRGKTKNDEILSKLNGIIWIDAAEKVVTRIEARMAGDFKLGGGLLLKIAPGAGFVFERQRLPDGFWVPRVFHWNASGKGFLVMSKSVYETTEWYNFQRFKSETGDVKLEAPKKSEP